MKMTLNRWKKDFNAIGIIPSSGKYSVGTFAHPDIAFEFASWLNVEFKLYLITEFERLKQNESYQNKILQDSKEIKKIEALEEKNCQNITINLNAKTGLNLIFRPV